MTPAIQCLRRSILYKTPNLLQYLQIQHHSQNPISHFNNFVTPRPSIQPQVRNFGSFDTETEQLEFKNILLRLLSKEIQSEVANLPSGQLPAKLSGFKVDLRAGEQWISLRKKIGKSEEIAVEATLFDESVPIPKEGEKPRLPGEEVQLHLIKIKSEEIAIEVTLFDESVPIPKEGEKPRLRGEEVQLHLIISIFKKESNQVLEFICSAFPERLEIKKLFVREQSKFPTKQPYTGPEFRELDDELQKSLYDFLQERGIDDNLCAYLHQYIYDKDKAEYIHWMESVKSMVE